MQRLTSPSSWRRLATATATAWLLIVAPAGAQVGTAITPLILQGDPAGAFIGFESSQEGVDVINAAGGVTLFAAYAPNGPLLVRLPFVAPFQYLPEQARIGWRYNGVPPGTYYLAIVVGIVNTPNISAAAWGQLVVPGACTDVPGMGIIDRDSAGVAPDTVRLLSSTHGGCATSFLVEAGTSPGVANVASFEQPGAVLSAGAGPAGNYDVRVRGRNQFGLGADSAVLPVSVPNCSTERPDEVDDLAASVVGHQVTLTWTAPATPPGRPITYYEIALLSGRAPGAPAPRFLLPAVSSVSGILPSGTYSIALYAGNACNSTIGGGPTDAVTFTVP